ELQREDFHALQLVFAAEVSAGAPAVLEVDGTTDAAAWVPVSSLGDEQHPVRDLVHTALAARARRFPV
ncbi:MAG TPA: hypothetical protein PLZ93_21460, partial [Nocardioides sp.]|nr:hypothetical protein [Nocardioides sp.]